MAEKDLQTAQQEALVAVNKASYDAVINDPRVVEMTNDVVTSFRRKITLDDELRQKYAGAKTAPSDKDTDIDTTKLRTQDYSTVVTIGAADAILREHVLTRSENFIPGLVTAVAAEKNINANLSEAIKNVYMRSVVQERLDDALFEDPTPAQANNAVVAPRTPAAAPGFQLQSGGVKR